MAIADIVKNPIEPASAEKPAARSRRLLGAAEAEAFRKLGLEVEMASPFGTVWLVPERTGQDRFELTPEEMATLVDVVRLFGGKIARLSREGAPLPGADAAAVAALPDYEAEEPLLDPDSAREHLRRLRESAPREEPAAPVQSSLFTPPARSR